MSENEIVELLNNMMFVCPICGSKIHFNTSKKWTHYLPLKAFLSSNESGLQINKGEEVTSNESRCRFFNADIESEIKIY